MISDEDIQMFIVKEEKEVFSLLRMPCHTQEVKRAVTITGASTKLSKKMTEKVS